MATLKTLWAWLAWSNLLLLLLQLLLTVGVWIVLLAFCTTRLIADHQHKQKNQSLRQQRQSLQQAWFDELLQAKRDARQRKNKALETELHLRETRLPANTEGNRDAIYDPHTGQIVVAPSGNFAQPVPNTFHYHVAVPGVKGSADKPEQLLAPLFPPPRDFADILQWFRPSVNGIYLADTIGEPVKSKVYELCHVGLGGKTGSGKTNATRLITAQLLADEVQASVYLATPNFSQVKLNGRRIEDWRPIVQRLAEPPAVEKEEIADLLNRFLEVFERRRRLERQTLRRQRDIFLVLGEWPAIVARVKDAPDILNLLLREARQYGVHVITEMQDTLVKTIGLSSGARENLRTGLYYGGDLNTAKVLLNLKAGESVNERGLGQQGAVYVRTYTDPPVPGRIPFFSNQALYLLLGTPPDPMRDEEMYDESQIPETYSQVDEQGRYVEGGALILPQEGHRAKTPQSFAMPGLSMSPRTVDASRERTPGPLASQLRDPLQVELFVTAYEITGNMDKSLERAGANTRFREHARQIIRERNVKKRET